MKLGTLNRDIQVCDENGCRDVEAGTAVMIVAKVTNVRVLDDEAYIIYIAEEQESVMVTTSYVNCDFGIMLIFEG